MATKKYRASLDTREGCISLNKKGMGDRSSTAVISSSTAFKYANNKCPDRRTRLTDKNEKKKTVTTMLNIGHGL